MKRRSPTSCLLLFIYQRRQLLQEIFILILFPVFYFSGQSIYAQNLPPKGVSEKYEVDYVQKMSTYYNVIQQAALTNYDMVKLRNTMVEDSVVQIVDKNNNIYTTIYHLQNSLLEDWMIHVSRTEIDPYETREYDLENNLLTEETHTSVYDSSENVLKQYLASSKGTIIPAFVSLTPAIKSVLRDSGYTVDYSNPSYVRFTRDTSEIIFGTKQLFNEINAYAAYGELVCSYKQMFKKNNLGQVVPSYNITKFPDPDFPAIPIQKIEVVEYPYFAIQYPNRSKREDTIEISPSFEISPDPVSAYFNLITEGMDPKDIHVLIYNGLGEKIYDANINGISNSIDASGWEEGIYLVSIISDGKTYSKEIIKNQ